MDALIDINRLKWDNNGLIAVVIQNAANMEVSMVGYMNTEALEITLSTGYVTFFSRSRQALWTKGETSGNRLSVVSISADCDYDALLVTAHVEGEGNVCHEGTHSCFHNPVSEIESKPPSPAVLNEVYAVIEDRKRNPKEGSYTNFLFEKGIDKIAKKVGEETAEVIIEAINHDNEALIGEAADLLYHLLVLMSERGITPNDVYKELAERR